MKYQVDSQRTQYERKPFKYRDQAVPNFLAKTYEILQKPQYNDIISWNTEGNGFVVKNITEFTQKILPKYFKHNNYASFVRQLNMYDIHKSKSSSSDTQVFTNPNFLRDNKEALKKIKRKKGKVEKSSDKTEQMQVDLVPNHSNELLIDQIVHLKKKQEELEKVVDVLAEQNKQILQDNKRLWKRMKKTMERQEKKFQNILFLFLLKNGHNPEDMMADNQIEGGNPEMNQALLPVQEPTRQNIMDALLSRFHNQHKPNYKDQLYLQNNGQHMKLLNNMMSQVNQNKDQNKYLLQYENDPSLSPSPAPSPMIHPLEDNRLHSIPDNIEQSDQLDDIQNLSLEKGISGEFPAFSDSLDLHEDFLNDSDK